MISLFEPLRNKINLAAFSNVLHDKTVREFEEEFAAYVGTEYAVSTHSATAAIFLIFKMADEMGLERRAVNISTMIPPVVPNAIITAGWTPQFTGSCEWVGHPYVLHDLDPHTAIIDSAQSVQKDGCAGVRRDDLTVFSFYPTKPIGSIDGGMVASNNKGLIEYLRMLSLNGTTSAPNSWDRELQKPGWKLYMNAAQAQIARENLHSLPQRLVCLNTIRILYNNAFKDADIPVATADSDHLYRVQVDGYEQFITHARSHDVVCGLHYRPLHTHPVYIRYTNAKLKDITHVPVSIPFHAGLTEGQAIEVVDLVVQWSRHQ